MFSWSLRIPFAIIYGDLWMPGKFTDSKGNTVLINAICDMSQFVVVVPVPDDSSATLPDHFFQLVLMRFVLCHLVVLDNGNPFKGTFVAMCKSPKLNFNILAKRNHNRLSAEHFHHFLNKASTIAMEDRQNNDVFVPSGIAAGYTWNSAPIDGTDILRSTVIGREFRFPIDIDLSALSQLTQNNSQSAVDFLRLTDSNRRFSSAIFNILIEDCRDVHAEWANSNKNIVDLVVGDIVMARTAVYSESSSTKVAKLSYQVHGPFRIITCTGQGSYLG